MRDMWVYILIAGFVAGVALHSFVVVPPVFVYLSLLVSVGVLLSSLFFTQRLSVVLLSISFFVACSLGLFRYSLSEETNAPLLDQYVGTEVSLLGVITEESDEREKNTLLTVTLHKPFETKILLSAERYPKFQYGDEIKFTGELARPKKFETSQGKLFDYPAYLAKDGIEYTMFLPEIERVAQGRGHVVKELLLTLKSHFLESVGRYIPEPEISLLGGLLVGAKHGLSKEWQDILRNAGIIHIVVLSGYNITIVAEAIMRFFGFLALRYRLLVGATAITLFAIMTGASATIVRASLMALLVLLARATGRTYEITRALMIAGFVMIIHNPKILIFDPSFQLSFLATLGLVYLAPMIEKYFRLVPTKFQIREFTLATLSTQIFVLPLLLFMTGVLSVVSLPTNLLVLPFIPLTMLLGFVTGVAGFVLPVLSLPFAYATYGLLHYELSISSFLGGLPGATISVPHFSLLSMLISYILLAGLLVIWGYKQKEKNQNVRSSPPN